jgi:myo-inositol-1(or 4)-monophosphatase
MDGSSTADWLAACRRSAEGLTEMLEARPTTRQRVEETGTRGEGGDRTLVIDEAAERLVFAQLDELHARGYRFTAVSEERGEVDYGGGDVRVVIDPIDGSLNAKRGLPAHALSIAVAEGSTMADVTLGYVFDLGRGEEWTAVRGEGARIDGEPLARDGDERRSRDGRLEVIGLESADPRSVAAAMQELAQVAHRLRALGSIALSLCQVAASRFDGMASLWRSRAVDAAAGQLIVREAGGQVAFTSCDPPLSAPLDTAPRSPVIAARSAAALSELERVPLA